MQLLKKIKKYLFPWLIFFIGQTWMMGMDGMIRLQKPREIKYIGVGNVEHYMVARHGVPDMLYFGLIYLIISYAVYQWFIALRLNEWRLMSGDQKIKRGLVFIFSLLAGLVAHFYMLFWYMIETGIDSL